MLITPHALTGAALAASFGSLSLALPLAGASHYLLDAIPSWDVGIVTAGDRSVLFADALITSTVLLMALRKAPLPVKIRVWAGAVVALLPDILDQSLRLAGVRQDLSVLHLHQYLQAPAPQAVSLTFQVFLSLVMSLYLAKRVQKIIMLPKGPHQRHPLKEGTRP
jgi:hypothetical protein